MKTKHVFAVDEDDEDYGSLLFDLTTLRRATANFAEENKLGHGGFGAVYKVRRTTSNIHVFRFYKNSVAKFPSKIFNLLQHKLY